jgi:rhamnogalacturonyl hydrolase YesR
MYFNMGIAAAFLARLTMATGDHEWADLGKKYLEIGFNVHDEMYETAQVGKVGWGSALIYGVTGDRRYLDLATRVGEALIAQQTDTGGWDNTGGYVSDVIRTEVTCEFIVLLDEMIGGIGSRA